MKPELNENFYILVSDQKFIDWVNNPTPELDKYWGKFIKENPSLKSEFDYAKNIVKRLNIRNRKVDNEISNEIWSQVQFRIQTSPEKIRILKSWMVAASIFLLVGIGGSLLYFLKDLRSTDYNSIAWVEPKSGEVKLILSDNTERLIVSNEPSIDYSGKGEVVIDSTALTLETDKKDKEEIFNQLVVPKGKRSKLILSDGTIVFLNSGSRVIYPVAFNEKKREIFIEGEAYLDVEHNSDWPFYVATKHMKIRVLGTEFNVKSYPEESNSSVVLVKGIVQAIAETGKVSMKESELLTVSNQTGKTKLERANVIEYISWKNGWLYCNNESIGSIAKKLSRYYDIDIQLKDEKVSNMTTTGKLDLKSEYTKVLDIITFTAPIKYEVADGKIIISTK